MNYNIEKPQVDDSYYQINAKSSIRTIVELLIEIISNSDDAYERKAKENHKNLHSNEPCRIEYKRGPNGQSSFIYCSDRATGMLAEELRNKLILGKQSNSGDATRGFWSRGLKDITAHGKLTIKTIKNNRYTEAYYSLKEFQQYFIYQNITPSSQQREDIGVRGKNGCGTKVEFELLPNTIPHTEFERIENSLRDHQMMKNMLMKNNKTIDLTFVNLNTNKKITIEHTPPKKIKTIHDGEINSFLIEKHQKLYNCNHKVHFELYEIEEDIGYISDTSLSGIYIEGNKEVFDKGFFKKRANTKYYKKIYGVLKTKLLDAHKEYWKNNEETNDFELNPSLFIEPTRRHGINLNHPLIKAITKKPNQILEKYIENLEKQSQTKEVHKDALKMKKELEDFLAKEFSELDEDLSEKEQGKLDGLRKDVWVPIPSKIKLAPEEEKRISVYTHVDTLDSKDSTLDLSVSNNNSNVELIESVSKALNTKNKDKKRFDFFIRAKLPKNEMTLNFKLNGTGNVKTQVKLDIEDFKDLNFLDDIEFENDQYNVTYQKKRTIKVFADNSKFIDNSFVNVRTENTQIARTIKNKFLLKQFKNTNYLVGTFEVKGLSLGEKTNIILDINGHSYFKEITVTNFDEKPNKHNFEIEFKDSDQYNYRYIWEENKLIITSNHNVFKQAFENNPTDIIKFGGQTLQGKAIFAEIFADALSWKIVNANIDQRPDEFYGDDDTDGLYSVLEMHDDLKRKYINHFYNFFYKSNVPLPF